MVIKLKIAAITVSFNRLAMIQRCVAAWRAQTRRPDGFIVADSASTDGTREWLAAQPDVTLLPVPNEGSAGGMHRAMSCAYAQGYDWFWLMDDDVVAKSEALAQLCESAEKHPEMRVFNSLCVGEQDETRPASGAVCWRNNPDDYLYGENLLTVAQVYAHADADGLLDTVGGQLYQGTLVHRSVVEQIGLPLSLLFTRGDEVEYGRRIMRAGIRIYSCTQSIVTHPKARITFFKFRGWSLPCEDTTPLKRYYGVRNSLYIRKEYYAGKWLLPYAARRLVGCIFTDVILYRDKSWRGRFASLRAIGRGVWDGLWFAPDLRAAQVSAHAQG